MRILVSSVIAGVLALGIGGPIFIHTNTKETLQVIVTDKERVTTGSGDTLSSKYLVFTEDEVFENTDAMLAGKFRSSDIQGRIKIGSECTFDVVGYRIGFLSSYRNILTADCS